MQRKYDGEDLFRAWCSWGAAATIGRLNNYAKTKHATVSATGPACAMWHWVFYHVDEAYPLYKEWYFNKHPDLPPLTFEDFTRILQKKASGQRGKAFYNITNNRDLARFNAKYGLPYYLEIERDDVIQVSKPNHALFQRLLIVDAIEGEQVQAFALNADGTRSNHQLSFNEIGVVGRSIV